MSEAPIQDQHRHNMNVLAALLDDMLNGKVRPKKIAFVLLVSEFGEHQDGRVNYISNADRKDTREMMEELIKRWGHGS